MRRCRPSTPRRWAPAASQRGGRLVGEGLRRAPGRRRQRRVEHGRVREVAADVDAGERHQLETGIAHALELVGKDFEHGFVDASDPGVATGTAHAREPVALEPRGLDVEELDVGCVRDEPLDRREHLAHLRVRAADDGDADRGALPRVLVVDLGDRHAVAMTQPVDDRTDRGALGLQRSALRNVQVEANGGRVHPAIFAPYASVRSPWCIRGRARRAQPAAHWPER